MECERSFRLYSGQVGPLCALRSNNCDVLTAVQTSGQGSVLHLIKIPRRTPPQSTTRIGVGQWKALWSSKGILRSRWLPSRVAQASCLLFHFSKTLGIFAAVARPPSSHQFACSLSHEGQGKEQQNMTWATKVMQMYTLHTLTYHFQQHGFKNVETSITGSWLSWYSAFRKRCVGSNSCTLLRNHLSLAIFGVAHGLAGKTDQMSPCWVEKRLASNAEFNSPWPPNTTTPTTPSCQKITYEKWSWKTNRPSVSPSETLSVFKGGFGFPTTCLQYSLQYPKSDAKLL